MDSAQQGVLAKVLGVPGECAARGHGGEEINIQERFPQVKGHQCTTA